MAHSRRQLKSKAANPRPNLGGPVETVRARLPGKSRGGILFYNIVGPSMHPTLEPGDLLSVKPYGRARLRSGDIVVFSPPREKRLITHRIVSERDGHFFARGDNNSRLDPWPLAASDIIGKVIGVERRGRIHCPASGPAGWGYGVAIRCSNMARQSLFRFVRPVYRWAGSLGILPRLWPFQRTLKIILISRAEGRELQLLWRGRVIGRLAQGQARWWIRPPYRLLVDESRLPGLRDRRR